MRKYGTVIALGVAVLFGIIAVVLANKWMTSQVTEEAVVVREEMPMTGIVVANQDLDIGTPLSEKNLTIAQWPKANSPKGAFNDISQVKDRVAVTKLVAGEPVLAAELAAPGSGAGLVALIPKGKRAMTIRVDEVIGVAGFILPNTFVDVIAVDQKRGSRQVKTILNRIKILAIAQETFTEEGKAKVVRTVTMELEPKDAEKLALQTHEGSIHLVLRNPLEEVVEEEPVVQKVAAKPRRTVPTIRPRVYAPKPTPFAVEVIRGSKNPETVEFKDVDSEDRL